MPFPEQIQKIEDVITLLMEYPQYENHVNKLLQKIIGSSGLVNTIPDTFKQQYQHELFTIARNILRKNEFTSEHYKAIEALNFEKEQLVQLVEQGHELSNTAIKIKSKEEFLQYNKRVETKEIKDLNPDIQNGMLIQNDVPIIQHVDNKKIPYIYETKFYPSVDYGTRGKDLNQLLKYQAAKKAGLIAGITLEIKGRISPHFLKWLEYGLVPDVQIIYHYVLPSNKIAQLSLQNALTNNINIEQPESLDDTDAQIINTLKSIFKSKEKTLEFFKQRLTLDDLQNDKTHPELIKLCAVNEQGKQLINRPYDITGLETYMFYVEKHKQKVLTFITNLFTPETIPCLTK